MFSTSVKKVFIMVIFTAVISCSLILYKNLKRITKGNHGKNMVKINHDPPHSPAFYDKTTRRLLLPANGSTKATNVRTAQQRPGLFDKYGLTNLKMFQPLDPPRKLFQFVMEPHGIRTQAPDELKGKEIKLTMIVAIKSHYDRVEQRNAIRNTWGSIRFLNGIRIEVFFATALPESQEIQNRLQNESRKFGDLLQVRMKEIYSDIGLKALASMQWISDHFPSNFLYFSGDDDVIPNLEILPTILEKMAAEANYSGAFEKKLPILCTYQYGPATYALRQGKWGVSKKDYPYAKYPFMCYGGFYGMSVKLAKSIYIASRYYPYFRMDDVFITAFMRLKVCDTYRDNEFEFKRTSKNCAISSFKFSGFLHAESSRTKFIDSWIDREKRLIFQGAEMVILRKESNP